MIITPPFSMNSEHFAAGGIFEPNAVNFPALKRHIKFAETSGNAVLDSITGNSISGLPAISSADSGKGVVFASAGTNVATPASFWPAIGALGFVAFTVMKIAGAPAGTQVFRFGSTTGARLGVSPASAILHDGSASASMSPTGIASASQVGVDISSIISGPNATPTVHAYDASDGSFSAVAGTPFASTGITLPDAVSVVAASNVSVYYETMLWVFAGALPTDIQAAIEWMTLAAIQGKKYPWPKWRGLA